VNAAIGFAISVLIVALLLGFAIWCAGLLALPAAKRVRTPTYNRFGERIGTLENPDFHIGPGEQPNDGAESTLHQAVRDGRQEG
jgi:hypothetical protein